MDSNKMHQATQQKHSGLAIAGMVLGIIALLTSCLIFGGFIGIIGLVLSIAGIMQKNNKTGIAIAGIVLNVIAIIIMVVMFIAVGSDNDESSASVSVSESDTTVFESAETPSTVIEPAETPSTEIDTIDSQTPSTSEMVSLPTVGDTIEGKTWKISLLDAKEYNKIEDTYYNDEPAEGNKYLVLFFEVENVSNEDDFFNYFYLESYLDSYNTDIVLTMNKPNGYEMLSGDVASGKKLKGCLVYEVPISGWTELEVSYKDWVGTSSKVATFIVTPDVISEN